MLRLWSKDGNRLIATEVVEAAGLGAGEPCSEAVQALSAPGVPSHISQIMLETITRNFPTCSRTRGIYHVFWDLIPLHPSINLLRLHHVSPYFEDKLSFTRLDKPPILSLSHDRLHLVRLDVLV
jgi:hypothetical protein